MITVDTYSEGRSDRKVFNWLILSEKKYMHYSFIPSSLLVIDSDQLKQLNVTFDLYQLR